MSNARLWLKGNQWRKLLCLLLFAATLSLTLGLSTRAYERLQDNICFTINSSSAGISQLFVANTPTGFGEEKSDSKALIEGAQTVCFSATLGDKYLRWDPNNTQATMLLSQVSVHFMGWRELLDTRKFTSVNLASDSAQVIGGTKLLVFANADPQIIFMIDDSVKFKEIAYLTIVSSLILTLAIYLLMFLFKKIVQEKNPAYQMASVAIAVLSVTHQFTGLIAVGDGSGWDGNAYLNLIFDWKQSGALPINDPYRLSRLAGFSPLIIMEFLFDFSRQQLIHIQVVFNIIGLGAATGFFLDYLLRSGLSIKSARQHSFMLLLTWPILVMSTYFPLLSDHLAIITSCFSLWCFSKRHCATLLGICLISPLIMPGLFLLPLTLLAFSNTQEKTFWLSQSGIFLKFKTALFLLLSTAMVVFAYHWLNRISDSELLHTGLSITPGTPKLRILSSVYVIGALLVTTWLWSNHFSKIAFFANLSIKWLLLALCTSIAGHAILYFGLDWNNGFKGPNLLQNMFYQALNAPLKPLLSHFIYFGPIFIVTLAFLFRSTDSIRLHYPVKIAILGFLPILAIGSETRQWVAILPFLVAFVAQCNITSKMRKLILGYSVLLAAPLFWLAGSVERAFALKLPMTDPLWQLYFGRQGPWMSQATYLITAVLMLVFIVSWMLTRASSTRQKMAAE